MKYTYSKVIWCKITLQISNSRLQTLTKMKNNQIKIIFQHINIYESCETDEKKKKRWSVYAESDGFILLWIFEFRDLELYRLKFTDPRPSLIPILDGTGYSSYCAWRRVGRKARVGIFTIWWFLPTRCDDFSFLVTVKLDS